MILSHKIQLDATERQASYFRRASGTARFVYNWALAKWNEQYESGEKPTAAKLKKLFNSVKYERFPWLREIHRDAHSQPFTNLQKAFTRFFKGEKNHPRFKKRGRCRDSFYVANDRFRVDGKRVRLPVVGWIRMTETLRLSGKIMGATVQREADRWFVSFQVEMGDYRKPRTGDGFVGVDLGVSTAATLSTGEKLRGPKALNASFKKLRRTQRSLDRKQKGSRRRQEMKMKLARLHARIANIRKDFTHKLTTRLCKNHASIGIESLNVRGMLKNRRLSRAISDMHFGEFARQMQYKSVIFRNRLQVADRWFPSSKTCNACGEIKERMSLSSRTFRCDGCGHAEDRDVNAAKNLENLCTGGFPGIDARGQEGTGRDRLGETMLGGSEN